MKVHVTCEVRPVGAIGVFLAKSDLVEVPHNAEPFKDAKPVAALEAFRLKHPEFETAMPIAVRWRASTGELLTWRGGDNVTRESMPAAWEGVL